MTAQEQLTAMRAAVQAELPALARELRLLSTQGHHDGGRFREIAAAMTEIPAETRLSIVLGEINRAALEVAAVQPVAPDDIEASSVLAADPTADYHLRVLAELSATLIGRSQSRHEAVEWAIRQVMNLHAARSEAAVWALDSELERVLHRKDGGHGGLVCLSPTKCRDDLVPLFLAPPAAVPEDGAKPVGHVRGSKLSSGYGWVACIEWTGESLPYGTALYAAQSAAASDE